ncbi:unnamed protein product [Rotaria sordida]|uniref:Uncharacterized protein n=1 Tax=Rotaria sordida TaxID=392033 RepID=A0A814A5V9_9BILA|nr:unnamed protein product [Rotaria sordida]CAF0905648.1 unnamed protein product [Rotaria sordida]CAF0910024.1 unnamed protein product [Rotaria sordida]CAF0912179.1 unnamed protein product [Rotaria sordida]CAF0915900.1 unnamed protein product [Rotaria sordida]
MVALLNISIIGFVLYVAVIVQADPSLEKSNDVNENKSPINNQQLYELYKIMRTDPNLASVSNNDIVLYIYRNFILGNGRDIDAMIEKYHKNRRHRHQSAVQVE